MDSSNRLVGFICLVGRAKELGGAYFDKEPKVVSSSRGISAVISCFLSLEHVLGSD